MSAAPQPRPKPLEAARPHRNGASTTAATAFERRGKSDDVDWAARKAPLQSGKAALRLNRD
jgi:hypothetical protein